MEDSFEGVEVEAIRGKFVVRQEVVGESEYRIDILLYSDELLLEVGCWVNIEGTTVGEMESTFSALTLVVG